MSKTTRIFGRRAWASAATFSLAAAGCYQQPVARVYIEDLGWAAHGSPQVDTSQLPKEWVQREQTADPGVGHGATMGVTVNGGPIRILLVPASNQPSDARP